MSLVFLLALFCCLGEERRGFVYAFAPSSSHLMEMLTVAESEHLQIRVIMYFTVYGLHISLKQKRCPRNIQNNDQARMQSCSSIKKHSEQIYDSFEFLDEQRP